MTGVREEVLACLLAKSRGHKHIAASIFLHALYLFTVGRITLPAAHAPFGNLHQDKAKQLIRAETQKPGDGCQACRRPKDRLIPQDADKVRYRGHIRVHNVLVGEVGQQQRFIVEIELELQARWIDALHLIVPGDEMPQGEKFGPVGTAVGHGIGVLEWGIADDDANRLALGYEAPNGGQKLLVHLWGWQWAHAELPSQHGIQSGTSELLNTLRPRRH